jgi:hypothetical protein
MDEQLKEEQMVLHASLQSAFTRFDRYSGARRCFFAR